MLSLGTSGNAPIAFMPTAARPHCILHARDLRKLAFFLTDFVGGRRPSCVYLLLLEEQIKDIIIDNCIKNEVDKFKKPDSGRVPMIFSGVCLNSGLLG